MRRDFFYLYYKGNYLNVTHFNEQFQTSFIKKPFSFFLTKNGILCHIINISRIFVNKKSKMCCERKFCHSCITPNIFYDYLAWLYPSHNTLEV